MSYRNKFLVAGFIFAAIPTAFAASQAHQGPVSADGSWLTTMATASGHSSRDNMRTMGATAAAPRDTAVSADGSSLIVSPAAASTLTRQQVQSESRAGMRNANMLPLIGLNG